MKLSFYPKPGMLCWDPERPPSFSGGHAAGYVGRSLVPAKKDSAGRTVEPARYVANETPYEVFSASKSGHRLAKLCRRGELWAADAATAAFCGVSFVPLKKNDEGEWDLKAVAAKPSGKKD